MGFFARLFGKTDAPIEPPPPGMARIVCTTTFLHGTDRFESGDVRSVPADDAAYFVAQGWAQRHSTLDVQDGVIASGDSNG